MIQKSGILSLLTKLDTVTCYYSPLKAESKPEWLKTRLIYYYKASLIFTQKKRASNLFKLQFTMKPKYL